MSDFLDLHDDAVARRALYTVAALLIITPFVQAVAQIWPLQLTNIQWRFGAANALSSVLLLPYLGLALLLLMARGLEHRGLARIVGSVSALFTLGLLASLAVFVLDSQELKTIVSTQMSGQFTNTVVRVGLVTTLFAGAFGLLTLFGFSSLGRATARPTGTKRAAAPAAEKAEDAPGLIVGLRD